jgi:sulfane dehydrogenase subunit SoxC
MSRDEAAVYTDFLPNGKALHFTFEQDANSVITRPSGGQRLEQPGFHEISGLAWSGRGRISKVEVSTDQGQTWQAAELQGPVFTKALTRFRLPWRWTGAETTLESRATDETGYVQPTREVLVAKRGLKPGPDGFLHYHGIKRWYVKASGEVSHV